MDGEAETLEDRIKKATNFKNPGNVFTEAANTVFSNGNGSSNGNSDNGSKSNRTGDAWFFNDEDFESKSVKENSTSKIDPDVEEVETEEVKGSIKNNSEKVTEQEKKDSAQMATAIMDMVNSTLFGGVEYMMRYKNAFTPEEWKRIKELTRADRDKLNELDKVLFDKIKRCNAKLHERLQEVEMEEQDIKLSDRAFYRHFDINNTKMGPNSMLISNIALQVIGQLKDIMFDDPYG
ncbi:MAG: hypothetical protein V4506_19270 [Bacteroidota bacterium]